MRFEAHSEEEMVAVGRRLAEVLPSQAVAILTGDLGAGKTTLAKGIAAARAGISEDEISSPTFALIHEYGDPVSVYHLDLYRLDTKAQVLGLGLDEIFDRPALSLIEWGERFARLIPVTHRITITSQSSGRTIDLVSGI